MPYVVNAGWTDVPHISPKEQEALLESIPPYQIAARTKGVPMLGSGAIYPIDEAEIAVDPFRIPDYWPRGYGMDVGWNWTAAVWMAYDTTSDILYIYDAYKRGQAEPSIHADAIKARGDWIEGEIDPAARARSQKDGEQLLELYSELGLWISPANNAVEAGLLEIWQRLSTGRLKVFKHLGDWFSEFRIYRRDEKGKVVKVNDHLMDATRYRAMNTGHMFSEAFALHGQRGGAAYKGST